MLVRLGRDLDVVFGHQRGGFGCSFSMALYLCRKGGWETCWHTSLKDAIQKVLLKLSLSRGVESHFDLELRATVMHDALDAMPGSNLIIY